MLKINTVIKVVEESGELLTQLGNRLFPGVPLGGSYFTSSIMVILSAYTCSQSFSKTGVRRAQATAPTLFEHTHADDGCMAGGARRTAGQVNISYQLPGMRSHRQQGVVVGAKRLSSGAFVLLADPEPAGLQGM